MKKSLIGMLILSLSMTACSVQFGSQNELAIPITTKAATPLAIVSPRALAKENHLRVVGTVDSTQGEHGFERGVVVICAFSKEGDLIEEFRGHFGSHEVREGPATHRHTDRTFSVELDIDPSTISRIDIHPDLPGLNCS